MNLEKKWRRSFTVIEREIERLRQYMEDIPYNKDFDTEMNKARERINFLESCIMEQEEISRDFLENYLDKIKLDIYKNKIDLNRESYRLQRTLLELKMLRDKRCDIAEVRKAREAEEEKGGDA